MFNIGKTNWQRRFTNLEKLHLLNLVAKNKHVIYRGRDKRDLCSIFIIVCLIMIATSSSWLTS